MMKDMPSVTSTWPSGLVFSRVNTSRSNSPPIAATARPAQTAMVQMLRSGSARIAVAPK